MSTWCVADTTGDLADLLGDHPNLDSYSSKFKTWGTIDSSSSHPVLAESIIMLHRRGVECIDFDDVVEKFFPTTTATAHLRHKLPAERTALRQLYKPGKKPKHRSVVIVVDDTSSDSDEVEVITKKHPIKQEEGAAAPPPQQRPRLTLDFDTVITIDDNDDSTPPLTAMSSSSSSTSTSTSTLNCLELNYT
ncbi:hypothetical protein K438DRAFT_1994300 [Mycena galopus ATCC 62051]|nr:hypothetical protein K438DRAFT_1994300 [Mycena galopus ATCC 62051]